MLRHGRTFQWASSFRLLALIKVASWVSKKNQAWEFVTGLWCQESAHFWPVWYSNSTGWPSAHVRELLITFGHPTFWVIGACKSGHEMCLCLIHSCFILTNCSTWILRPVSTTEWASKLGAILMQTTLRLWKLAHGKTVYIAYRCIH
jgi:hypothetical protein